jgi:hypothetical protein
MHNSKQAVSGQLRAASELALTMAHIEIRRFHVFDHCVITQQTASSVQWVSRESADPVVVLRMTTEIRFNTAWVRFVFMELRNNERQFTIPYVDNTSFHAALYAMFNNFNHNEIEE